MWALVLGRGGFEPPKALGQLIYSQSRLTASVSARPGDFTDNRPMGKRRWILWQGLIGPSMERFVVARTEMGCQLAGLILRAHQDSPYVVSLVVDGAGHWSRDGEQLQAFDNCVDVDLEWSPSTNTLPIRRLGLALGESRAVTAAWVRFPSLEVQHLEQSYERVDERRYRYRCGRFTADLAVDDDGMVRQYGVNWMAVASSGELG